jgi:hypothetical protein
MRDYDSIAFIGESSHNWSITEVYSGEGVVGWHGNIERQLDRMLTTYEAARNQPYTDKLAAYIKIWRNNPMSGSINVEDIEKLLGGTEVLAVDNWHLKNYFSNLRDQLRRLKASEEEMPRGDAGGPMGGPKPRMGSMGRELASDFGTDADKLPSPDNAELPPTPGEDSTTQPPVTA